MCDCDCDCDLCTAASTLAGLSSFGSLSIETTEMRIFSIDCTGDHRSELDSY
jgi:1-aminocyclopropane-1-carboxylate deaminase/D-cysteine desulfhydrase-like pyridoxal-dependent ACC family enzyme